MGASLFYKLSKVNPLFLTELNHPSQWTEEEIGDGKERWAPCPCPSFSSTSSMGTSVFLHGLCSQALQRHRRETL